MWSGGCKNGVVEEVRKEVGAFRPMNHVSSLLFQL